MNKKYIINNINFTKEGMKKTMLSQKLKKEVKRKSLIALITLALIAAIVAVSVNLIKTAKSSDGNSYEVTLSDVYDMKGKNATTANVKIVGGYNYFVSMDASGKVYGWGQNNNGQLAQGNKLLNTSIHGY